MKDVGNIQKHECKNGVGERENIEKEEMIVGGLEY